MLLSLERVETYMLQIVCVLLLILLMMVLTKCALLQCKRERLALFFRLIFAVYALGYLYFTFLSRTVGSGAFLELRPFHVYTRLFIDPVAKWDCHKGFGTNFILTTSPIVRIILNIFLYYPLGYLLPIIFPKLNPKCVILIGCLCSISTEVTQYILKMGWCETDDVIHNTLGTAIGVWAWSWQSKRLNTQRSANPEIDETQ